MEDTIAGPALTGFGDLFTSETDVGAARRQQPQRPAAGGASKPRPWNKVGKSKGDHGKSRNKPRAALAGAVKAGGKAEKAAGAAAAKLKGYADAKKAGQKRPLVPIAPTRVKGDGTVVLGAAPKAAAKISPKARAAVQKHNTALMADHAAAKKLARAAIRAKKAGAAAKAFVKKNAPIIKAAMAGSKGGRTAVRGLEAVLGVELPAELHAPVAAVVEHHGLESAAALIGALVEEHGPVAAADALLGMTVHDLIGDDAPADPNAPPTDPNDPSLLDPNADPGAGLDAGADEGGGSGVVTAPDGTVLYDPSKDPDVVEMPVRGKDLAATDAQAQWDHVPDGAIVVPASPGQDEVGSWSLMYDKPWINEQQGVGFIWHQNPGEELAWWGIGISEVTKYEPSAGGVILAIFTGGAGAAMDIHKSKPVGHGVKADQQSTQEISRASRAAGLGPIVGNPKGKFKNAQYAQEDDKFFFLPDNAPTWATQDIDMKVAQANKATIAANRAAAAAQAAQMVKDATDAKEAQARQDAANALQESKAQSDAAVAAQQTQAAQAAAEQKQGEEEGKLSIEQARAETQYAAKAGEAQIEQQRREAETEAKASEALIEQTHNWNEWAKTNPEKAYGVIQAQGGGGGGGGGGEAEGDEGGGDEGGGDEGGDDEGGGDEGGGDEGDEE